MNGPVMVAEPSLEVLKAMYEAMFETKWDASQAVLVGAAYDAARKALVDMGLAVTNPNTWKDMAAHSAALAALRANEVQMLLEAGKALLEVIPDHWHDEATTDFRDAVASVEKHRSMLAGRIKE